MPIHTSPGVARTSPGLAGVTPSAINVVPYGFRSLDQLLTFSRSHNWFNYSLDVLSPSLGVVCVGDWLHCPFPVARFWLDVAVLPMANMLAGVCLYLYSSSVGPLMSADQANSSGMRFVQIFGDPSMGPVSMGTGIQRYVNQTPPFEEVYQVSKYY